MDQSQLKAVIIGSSGAVGRELVRELLASNKWSEVSVIVRRKLAEWDQLMGIEKLKVIQVETLDELENQQKWQQFVGYNTFFCCLGSRTKEGDAQFYKVDFTYCLWGGKIAQANKIPHYSLVSSVGADKTSMFLYMRTKGQIEEELTKLNFPFLSINRPGAILNRENDCRFGETILKYTPFMSKIESKDLAKALRIGAENTSKLEQKGYLTNIYTNDQLKSLLNL